MSSEEPPVGGSGDELPPGWSEHQSKSNQGKTYYFNRRTGERLWDRAKVKPEDLRLDPDVFFWLLIGCDKPI